MNLKQCDNFNYAADQYAVQYLYEKERKEFKDWISTRYLKEQLSRRERITYHYRSKPNPNQHEFFEAQAIKIYQDEKHFFALVGFRHIDDIMEKETTIQNQLRQALDETRLSNEIISAIAKSYCSIYRIDVQKDFFEEVSNDSEIHKLTGNRGCASEKLYQLCDTMVAPEYRPLIRPFLDVSTLSARLKTEECISTEYRMCDGSWHRMLFTVKKRDESGNVTHVLCTVRSISDSKRREENLNFAAEAAKREAEMKTRFLATMSHDIRTPLTSLDGYFQLMEECENIEDQKRYLSIIHERIHSLNEMLEELFMFTKLKNESYSLELTLCCMNRILKETVFSYYDEWVRMEIQPDIQITEEQLYIHGNRQGLRRVIQNVIKNGLDHGEKKISIVLERDQNQAVLRISNQVTHPEQINIDQVFERFYKADVARSKTSTGLGLSIAKELVSRMDGEIEAKIEKKEFIVEMNFPIVTDAK